MALQRRKRKIIKRHPDVAASRHDVYRPVRRYTGDGMVTGRDRQQPGRGTVFPVGGGDRLAADDWNAVNRQHVGRELGVAAVVHLVAPGLCNRPAVRIYGRNRHRVLIAVRRLEPKHEPAAFVRPEILAGLRLAFDDDVRDIAVRKLHVKAHGKHRLAGAVLRGGRNRVRSRIDRREAECGDARLGRIGAVAYRGRAVAWSREHRAAVYRHVGISPVTAANASRVLSAASRHHAAIDRDFAVALPTAYRTGYLDRVADACAPLTACCRDTSAVDRNGTAELGVIVPPRAAYASRAAAARRLQLSVAVDGQGGFIPREYAWI